MKSIKESIIGRKGIPSRSKVWIMYPMNKDYDLAKYIFPEEYMVRAGSNYVFCIDDVQWLKRYFERGNNKYPDSFPNQFSKLCVVKRNSHFRNLDQIKEWIQSIIYTDDIYISHYVDVIKDIQKYIKTL